MRSVVLAAAMLGTVASAQAADMPDFLRGSFSSAPAPSRNWSGYYAGGQIGYTTSSMDFSQSLGGLTNFIYRNSVLQAPTSQLSALSKVNAQGNNFGAFAGRNWQWDDIVFGIEANYNHFNSFRGSSTNSVGPLQYSFPPGQFTPANDTPNFFVTVSGKATAQIEDVLTFRGRAGWATGDFLPYVFGGLAVGRMDVQRAVATTTVRRDDLSATDIFGVTTITIGTPFLVPSQSTTASQARSNDFVVGWTGGLGLEYMVWNCLFVRGEWEYIKFLSVMNSTISMNSARLGIGYKF
jgi:outer membrane immunogenic protein